MSIHCRLTLRSTGDCAYGFSVFDQRRRRGCLCAGVVSRNGGGAEIGPTRRGKGVKIMAIVDRNSGCRLTPGWSKSAESAA